MHVASGPLVQSRELRAGSPARMSYGPSYHVRDQALD
jgi:hypothetical protein